MSTKVFTCSWEEFQEKFKRLKFDGKANVAFEVLDEPITATEAMAPEKPDPITEGMETDSSVMSPGKMDKRLAFDEENIVTAQAKHDYPTISVPISPIWFKTKLKSIFKDNLIGRTVNNKSTGKLDLRRLFKVHTTDKVFCKKENVSKKGYNVLLLVDTSGSMHGNSIITAVKAMATLVRDIQDVVSLEVAIFNCRYKVLKKFDEKIPIYNIGKRIMTPSIGHMKDYGCDNHDHIAIQKATDSLMTRKGPKILLVLSDGEPSCNGGHLECNESCSGDIHTALKVNIKQAERLGITVLSIGIASSAVQHYYSHYKVISSINMLYDTITGYLDTYIKRLPIMV